jgi:hypothetical protein
MKDFVHPGSIRSKNDGDTHFISFNDLVRLYKLDPANCINANTWKSPIYPEGARHFFPNYDGNYNVSMP